MADENKLEAVEKYLKEEFDSPAIERSFDSGQDALVLKIKTNSRLATAVITNQFLEKNPADDIPGILRTFMLAEHLRECDFPVVVTRTGLTD